MPKSHPLPVGRWIASAWMVFFVPYSLWAHGAWNLLYLCEISVLVTCLGVVTGSPLLVSSQAVFSLPVQGAWSLDVLALWISGRHLFAGNEFMIDPDVPALFRLVSLYHVVWPFLVVFLLVRLGYDRRGLYLQAVLTLGAVALARFAGPAANINSSFVAPLGDLSWEPALLHVLMVASLLLVVAYLPCHLVLSRLVPPAWPSADSRTS